MKKQSVNLQISDYIWYCPAQTKDGTCGEFNVVSANNLYEDGDIKDVFCDSCGASFRPITN